MAIQLIGCNWCPYAEGYRKRFIADAEADVSSLPVCCAGSSALVAESGNIYIANTLGEWKKLPASAGAASSVLGSFVLGQSTL